MDKGQVAEIYKNCRDSVEYFARFFFPHLLSKGTAEFQREIYQKLPKAKYLAIAVPRGHAKSTIGSIIYPIWFSLFRGDGNISILSASESFVLNEICRVIKRELEQNEKILAFFGVMKTQKWSETYFVLGNGVAIEGGGIGGQLRGGRRGLILLDDLENNETVESEDQRSKLRDRVNKELVPKLLPGGQIIYLGTLIHPLCYLNQIIEVPNNGWEKIVYDCYVDGVESEGHEIWKEMLPHKELQHRKSLMGTHAFNSEYRNKPSLGDVAPIKEDQIRYWERLPEQYNAVMVIDPAYSDDETADWKTCSLIINDVLMNRYLVHYIRTHAPIGEFQEQVLNLWMQNRGTVLALGIPNSGTEKAFFDSFLKKCEEKKLYPPVVELKNVFTNATTGISVRNKKARVIAALQPLFEQGKYFIHSNHLDARDELLTIGMSRWDDVVDTMAYAEQIIQPFYEPQPKQSVWEEQSTVGFQNNYGMD